MNNKNNWWSDLKRAFATATVGSVCAVIGRIVFEMIAAGIIINIVASSFYPELPSRFPVVYGLFDGCLQFGEFLFKVVIKVVTLTVTLRWGELLSELGAAFAQLVALLMQLLSWAASIHF